MAPTSLIKAAKRKRDDDEDSDDAQQQPKSAPYRQRVLVLSSRGITQRNRHLMNDITQLLPHSKKDAKLDTKHQLALINELCDLSSCNNALFFEARRQYGDLYLWAAKTPNGPSIRFHVLNTHTMDELKMTGNCLKGSRPIVVFDQAFDTQPHLRVIKEVLTHIFAVPKTARRAKPFIDHVLNISIVDGKIWFRNYQIIEDVAAAKEAADPLKRLKKNETGTALSEIGPRFVLQPVKIFEGAFNGATLYENKAFVPSSSQASERKTVRAAKYKARKEAETTRKVKTADLAGKKRKDPLEVASLFK